jgi:uncharacterized protein with NRDE domain
VCTVVLLIRPGHKWPLALAANRDEMLGRPWDAPGPHWPLQPDVVAGRDRLGGGTWMGLNRHGVVATVLNRPGSLGPAPDKRSRGELPLLALMAVSANSAAATIEALDAGRYRSFNMVIADRTDGLFVSGMESGQPRVRPLSPGLHMVTAHDPDDLASARIARHLPRFRAAPAPDPAREDSAAWEGWREILADDSGPADIQINVRPRNGFATVCSAFLALPDHGPARWLFAAGPPGTTPFRPVSLPL